MEKRSNQETLVDHKDTQKIIFIDTRCGRKYYYNFTPIVELHKQHNTFQNYNHSLIGDLKILQRLLCTPQQSIVEPI